MKTTRLKAQQSIYKNSKYKQSVESISQLLLKIPCWSNLKIIVKLILMGP